MTNETLRQIQNPFQCFAEASRHESETDLQTFRCVSRMEGGDWFCSRGYVVVSWCWPGGGGAFSEVNDSYMPDEHTFTVTPIYWSAGTPRGVSLPRGYVTDGNLQDATFCDCVSFVVAHFPDFSHLSTFPVVQLVCWLIIPKALASFCVDGRWPK